MPTLLLADDSVTIQRVIELTFAEQGMRVVSVGDGESAIARMTAERPDIVLADVGMRRVDGYQVAAHMKGTPALAQVPVLLLTGAFEPIDEERARRAGCDGVLVKPFEPRQLLAQVRALLSGQRPADLWPADMPRVDTRPARTGPAKAAPPPAAPADGSHLLPPRAQPLELSPPRSAPAFDTMPEPGPVSSAPPAEAAFELGLDDLDLAFSRLDPVAAPGKLDAETVSDFQRDIHELRSAAPEEPRERAASAPSHFAEDMDWDLPARAPEPEPVSLVEAPPPPPLEPLEAFIPAPSPAPAPPPSVPEPKPEPVPVVFVPPPAPAPVPPTPPPPPAPQQPPPSLASAFSALLAAEQTQPQLRPSAAGSPALSDAAVEEVVKRVVTRMTDEVVRKVVLETAERLIREEIERIKT
ncbi:MAG: response regulator [Acidobacteria bacterium]|nr:response regulator [Acidobacteriota bacterium]